MRLVCARLRRGDRGCLWACLGAVACVAWAPADVAGQQARGWISSTAQAVGMRPVATVSQPCPATESCYVALDREVAMAASQDLFLTAWGLGLQGLSSTVHLRTRQNLGGGFPWPRTDDGFDVMLAHGTLTRGAWTARVGRQELRTGLGFPSFDGGLIRWSQRTVRVELYGGRSLARGLRDPAAEALRGFDDFVPDQSVFLFGGAARGRVGGTAFTARYHREILGDRSGLASERGSLDLSAPVPVGSLRAALDYDFGRGIVGKAHVTFARTFQEARWHTELSASRYVPYFSLSTIWGFFEPVSYSEAVARVGWAPSDAWTVRTSAGLRRYGDAGTVVVLRPLERTGRRADVDVRWSPAPAWSAGATYGLEWGPGGYLSSAEGRVTWTPTDDVSVLVAGHSFQQIEQYRLGDGRAVGASTSARAVLGERWSLSGGASLLRHRSRGGAVDSPWNQARGWVSVRVHIGEDPGPASLERGR